MAIWNGEECDRGPKYGNMTVFQNKLLLSNTNTHSQNT